jgi:beta-galactosidase
MMQRAGVSVVRMGEFAWSALEPREGEMNFAWLEEAIDLLGKHDIKTILCTYSRYRLAQGTVGDHITQLERQ